MRLLGLRAVGTVLLLLVSPPAISAVTAEIAALKAINDLQRVDRGATLTHPRYEVAWTSRGVVFEPRRGPSWAWSLGSVSVGPREVNLDREVRPFADRERLWVDYDRGALIERYLCRMGAVEQQFVLPRRVSSEPQDLIIEGDVRSAGSFEATSEGWLWRDARGVVSLGRVTVFDAAGSILPARMEVTAEAVRLTVDGMALTRASYPVTIDPEIGTDDFRISDMGPDGSTLFTARTPDVAYNATNHEYLVVWDGDDVDGQFEIYGQRIDAATGAEVGANDFRISDLGPDGSTAYGALTPAVAWNSDDNEYLVVWRGDDNTAPLVDNEQEVFGQRLAGATGAEIGVDFRISDMGPDGDTTYGAAEPAVAYDPNLNQYLVVWRGDDTVAPNEIEIWGQLLTAAGAHVGPNDFRISDTGDSEDTTRIATSPHVAYNSANQEFLVVWHADDLTVDNDTEIFGQRITAATGLEVGTSDFRISDMGPENNAEYRGSNPRVAYNPSLNEYLVVWVGNETSTGNNLFVFEIYGQRLAGATGAHLGTNDFRISDMGEDTAFLVATRPDVSWSAAANEYLVVWYGDDTVDNENEIWGQRLSASGAEVGINDFRLSRMGPDGNSAYTAINPRVAFGAGGLALVVWQSDDDSGDLVDNEFEIYGQFYQVDSSSIRGDFNADGNVDLLWRNYDSGAVNVWFLNGTTYLGGSSLFTVTDPNWRIEGTGDFNGDGNSDLIWRHYASGAVSVWFLNGTTYLGGASMFTVPDLNWKIQAVGDFNGDGKDDLIWRNYATGAVNVWLLNGTTYLGGVNLFTVADPNWRIEVAGDFNGDGKNDLIWRNYSSGAVNVWYLNGTTYLGGASLFTVAGADWDIEAAGDYNGDGNNDLIWRNYWTGAVNVWFLNGSTYLGGATMFNVADPAWEIAGPR